MNDSSGEQPGSLAHNKTNATASESGRGRIRPFVQAILATFQKLWGGPVPGPAGSGQKSGGARIDPPEERGSNISLPGRVILPVRRLVERVWVNSNKVTGRIVLFLSALCLIK